MEILSFLKPKKQKRLVSENDFDTNLLRHLRLATESLVSLRDAAVEEEDELKIDYFFNSDTLEKAQELKKELHSKSYIVNYEAAQQDKNLFVISGKTTEIKMMHESLSQWVTEMCELGYKHDCKFDSWTIVPQK
ncbi:ribonuclease E inhibitor RraB [Flavobacterium sp. DG2-3]|uniref:ribonuclease E inhibitor RraB n=1 Tax=Flavobacterium sp. DG2-3 TaxID=3068317 RepID=UPI00273DCC68|nr:ribonuclease E inhibitor RraB [Flavobacterium sp. DG2-3]MDP5201891.1 ribonuclease E inhibitor RraB [Flavobacterium sp. DG2-3]